MSAAGPWTKGVASVASPNTAVQAISSRRRPKRSAKVPNTIDPNNRPNSPALNTGAKSAMRRPQSAAMAGAVKARAWLSNPSQVATATHNASATAETGRSLAWSTTAPTSTTRWPSIGRLPNLLGRVGRHPRTRQGGLAVPMPGLSARSMF